jgi:diguanylate cyclase (GGDEF)-like protein
MGLSDRLAEVEQQLASAQHKLAEHQQTEAALRHSEQQLRTLYHKAHRQAQELELLGQVRAALARELDLLAVFRTIVEAVAQVFGYTHVSLYTLEQDTLILRHQVGYNSVIERVLLSSGISGRVMRNGQPLLIEDVCADPDFLGAIEGIVSQVCVPVFDDQCAIGVINVESNNGVRLSNEDLHLIIALAEHVGIAINRARLYGAVQYRVQELEALRATMTEISANLDLDALLSSILERQVALLGATAGELCLYEPNSKLLHIVASHNLDPSRVGTWLALGEGIMGQVALNRTPIVMPNYHLWLNRVSGYEGIGPITVMAVPMLAGDQLIGILGVGDTNVGRVFTADDLRLLSLFAQQATVAIQNARLFAETHHLATIDPLTGLANRRAFYAMAHHAFEYAHRCGHYLSAIMMDVDDFKRVNDLYGHAVGDHVLHEIGQRCRETLRSMDVIGRYGGEEMAILLPNTDQKAAQHVAERLRIVLAKPSSKEAVSITVSIGVATYEPSDAIDLDLLIDRADRAQYMAKHAGKNRVIAWSAANTIRSATL